MEVLLGLTIMGIVLAKVTSRRLSHYIQRLFSSDAQKKIERFAGDFTNSADDLQQAMTILSETYQATPGQGSVPRGDTLGARSSFKKAISTLHTVTSTLHEYLSYETEQGGYFAIIPMDAFLQLGNSIDKDMLILGQLIISLSPKARIDVFLEQDIRQQISKIVDKQRITCQFVEKHCQDETVKNCFFQIRKTCDGVPESYFVTPIISVEKPDQLPKRGDEPQIPSASPQDET